MQIYMVNAKRFEVTTSSSAASDKVCIPYNMKVTTSSSAASDNICIPYNMKVYNSL